MLVCPVLPKSRRLPSRAPPINGSDKLARDVGMLRLSKLHLHPASQPGKGES
jgi:hypothetical protein